MALPYNGSVTAAQDVLKTLTADLAALRLPALGPAYSEMSGAPLADALVAYRFTKKFQAPSDADPERRMRSIEQMLAYDSNGPTQVPQFGKIPPHVFSILVKARKWLADTFADFKQTYVCRFPSGESHSTTHGWPDVIAKMAQDEAWEVSLEAAPQAAAICYHNIQLKRIIKRRFWAQGSIAHAFCAKWTQEALSCGKRDIGFYVFKHMFLYQCNIVGTSRVTTVPKDNSVDRVITCEPFWNMVVQLSLAADLRNSLFNTRGIHLESAQDLHRTLIADGSIATIDFSNASNSNWLCWLKFLWPPKILKPILRARTGLFEYVDGNDETHYQHANMLAPMGCGFTFEVMTATLFAISRSLDNNSRVFGDDVIITASAADRFVDVMSYIGWQVNSKKTFVKGNFRESCGAFYDLRFGRAVVCFDLEWPTTLGDVFVIIQKIERILLARQVKAVRPLLSKTLVKLLAIIPRDAIVDERVRQATALNRGGFAEDICPTLLAKYFQHSPNRVKRKPTFVGPPTYREFVIASLNAWGWEPPILASSYKTGMQSRPVKDHERIYSVACSFYAMRARETVQSRKKETKVTRTTVISGAMVPLSKVPWRMSVS